MIVHPRAVTVQKKNPQIAVQQAVLILRVPEIYLLLFSVSSGSLVSLLALFALPIMSYVFALTQLKQQIQRSSVSTSCSSSHPSLPRIDMAGRQQDVAGLLSLV